MKPAPGILLVANWDSDVGYAWWLMERFWRHIADHFSSSFTVHLAYPTISRIPEGIAQAPITVCEQRFRASTLPALAEQVRFLRRHRILVMYLSDWPTWSWRYAIFRAAGVRTIITHDHSPGLRPIPGKIKGILKSWIHRQRAISVDVAIGATDFVVERLRTVNCVPSGRCFSVPNGLPETHRTSECADLRRELGIPTNIPILIMAGRANRYKGVSFVLRCISRLRNQLDQPVHFLFVGDGPDLQFFKSEARDLAIDDICTFYGHSDDVPSLLAVADIAMHPSQGEVGYSLSILEYMRAGLPVIVPDNPSVCGSIIHNDTGLVYPEGSEAAATDLLSKLISRDDIRRKIGSRAAQASECYSLHQSLASLISAFENALRHADIDQTGNL